ncbi:MAG: cytochrome c [Ignavibacteriales bacterium]|nr:cytochrome c [Ignavibacteriales bacterium]
MADKNSFEPEIEFKDLPKNPSRLFGWVFPYYAVLFLVMGIYFVKHMNSASFNNVPAIYTDSLIVSADVEMKKGGIMPAIDLGIISNPNADLIGQGKTLFQTNCSSCHGTEGKGDGVAAAALTPKPRNFHETEGWTNGRTFTDLYNTLEKGVPNTGMIAYEFIPAKDRIAIIQYLRTFTDFPKVSDQEIAKLDENFSFSKGVATASNITLEMATKKIAEEANTKLDLNVVIEKINQSNDKNIVGLFNSYALDKEKVLVVFSRDYLKTNNADLFIDRLIASPSANGFKPSIVELPREQIIQLFNVLVKAVS